MRLRTDSEASIAAVARSVATKRGSPTHLEINPRGSSASLGAAERACQSLSGLARTLKLQVEALWKRKVFARDHIFSWLVRHASWILNRYQKHRATNCTSFELLQHRQFRMVIYPFSSVVLCRGNDALQLASWNRGGTLACFLEFEVTVASTSLASRQAWSFADLSRALIEASGRRICSTR